MKIPKTDLHIPDILYSCPMCTIRGYWKIGNLSRHVKANHPEHYTGN